MIDVCVITKNPKSELMLKCLKAIEEYIPYNKLIVVSEGTRGEARQKCIEAVTSEIFAFIDDDVIVDESWYSGMMFWMKKLNAGAVTGVPDLKPKTDARRFLELLIREIDLNKLPQPINCLHTGSCLIRTELVKDIQIPRWLQHREDLYITEHIKAKGYECYRVPIKFRHIAGGTWESLYAENIANLRVLGKLTAKSYLRRTLGSWFGALKLALKHKEPKVMLWNFPRMFAMIKGYDWRRYLYVKH